MGLSKELGANGPGTRDSIGTFLTLDPTSVDDVPANDLNPWFAGTTYDWTLSGAEAVLDLPIDAQVLYAELVWGGSSYYGVEDVRDAIDGPVTLAIGNDSLAVLPDATTGLDVDEMSAQGFFAHYYMRTADVTDFVADHGEGTYAVTGVPATQDTSINSLNAAGWTLVVAYRDSAQPIRNLTVFVGGSFVDEQATEDYSVAGFCTPPMGPFDGTAVVSALEGDANLVGDELVIGPDEGGPFANLSGPNNPIDNFFASQMNGPDGMLDTSGTFGTANHDAVLGLNAVGARQGWDITHVPVSSAGGQLDNGQTSAVLRTQTSGDSYVPTTVAFAIGVNAPDFSGDGTGVLVAPTSLADDESATVTISMNNVGLVDASDVTLTMPLPTGLELDSYATDGNDGDIDGNAVATADLTTGVAVGTVGPGEVRQIVMSVRAAGAPDDLVAGWTLQPQWTYSYVSCVGEPPLEEPAIASGLHIDYEPAAGHPSGADSGERDHRGGRRAAATPTACRRPTPKATRRRATARPKAPTLGRRPSAPATARGVGSGDVAAATAQARRVAARCGSRAWRSWGCAGAGAVPGLGRSPRRDPRLGTLGARQATARPTHGRQPTPTSGVRDPRSGSSPRALLPGRRGRALRRTTAAARRDLVGFGGLTYHLGLEFDPRPDRGRSRARPTAASAHRPRTAAACRVRCTRCSSASCCRKCSMRPTCWCCPARRSRAGRDAELLAERDAIVIDHQTHRSVDDAITLQCARSRATKVVVRHGDLDGVPPPRPSRGSRTDTTPCGWRPTACTRCTATTCRRRSRRDPRARRPPN
ncbi:MAG: hypothetical protein U0168_24920 [Nannocystaceae bacterium]